MRIVEFGRLSDRQRAELEGDEDDPFDAARVRLTFRGKDRHLGIVDARGRLIASTGFLIADVAVADTRFAVVGIGGVIVSAAFRGRGLARVVVEETLARVALLGPAFALLFCHEDRSGLYARLGFAPIPAPVAVEQADGLALIEQLAMWRALRPGASWPAGPVTLVSLPF